MAEGSHPMPKVRGCGQEEQSHVQRAAAARCRRTERSYSTFKVRRGGLRRHPLSKVRRSCSALLEQL